MKTAIILVAGLAAGANAQLINEFEPNPSGADPAVVNFEIKGNAGESFNGVLYSLDTDFSPGQTIDRISQISGVFDSNGILNVMIDDLENPSFSLVLASGGTGSLGQGFDPVNFAAQFGTIYDAINIPDIDTDAANSIIPFIGGTDFAFVGSEPIRTFRDGITNAWYSVDFNGIVYDVNGNILDNGLFDSDPTAYNFGGVNQTVIPAPGAVAVLGLGGLAAARRRR